MKKNKTAIIIAIVLIAIAIILVWNNRYLTTLRGDSADFMVWDTASITKVYLADRLDHETSTAWITKRCWNATKTAGP